MDAGYHRDLSFCICHRRDDVFFGDSFDPFGWQSRSLMPFRRIFGFSERKLDISNFAGKLLTVYSMTISWLKISSSPSKTEKKVLKVLFN
jgi:hypothetical protein